MISGDLLMLKKPLYNPVATTAGARQIVKADIQLATWMIIQLKIPHLRYSLWLWIGKERVNTQGEPTVLI